MSPRCLFSYYGSKSKIAGRYPPPRHDIIVEPFAGGASYSLRYPERQVILFETNPRVYAIWNYLLTNSLEDVLDALPKSLSAGDLLEDAVGKNAPAGLLELCRANCNMGSAGRQVSTVVSSFGALHWDQVSRRLEHFVPLIGHWRVFNRDYRKLPNGKATWFVDPPYNNPAGRRYTYSDIDYPSLAEWCRERRGQVIVCENFGADWLPFKPMGRGLSRGGVRRAVEAVWINV